MGVWRRLLGFWDTEESSTKGKDSLTDIIEQARLEWIAAQSYYLTVTDPDLIDYSIFLIKACERRYMYLLKKARQEGIRHPGIISMSGITGVRTIRQAL
ncbi:YaaL family protein [Sporomusa sp. KB1]|jgi:hypothetical protein|uniref:YaaL family protein n=1 Tax=Sporomusa sp. KB1 TaxID=943346 RepID=UPI0011A984B7|nr:YaaL family protein [Sporomusa sp. KB1]TWH46157.1 uncharacterized protein DUF2508 [Sporomusa sp. KB1]